MVTPELLEFIRAQHKEGISREDLEGLLVSEGGWTKEDIAEGYATMPSNEVSPSASVPIVTTQRIQDPVIEESSSMAPRDESHILEVPNPKIVSTVDVSINDVAPTSIKVTEPVVTTSSLTDGESPAVFRRPTIEIVDKPTEPEVVVAAIPKETPASDDDFLGIFNAEATTSELGATSQSEIKTEEPLVAIPVTTAREVIEEKVVISEVTPTPNGEISQEGIGGTPAISKPIEMNSASSIIDNPPAQKSISTIPTRTLGDLLTGGEKQTHPDIISANPVPPNMGMPQASAPVVTSAASFKFDLSKIRPTSTTVPIAGIAQDSLVEKVSTGLSPTGATSPGAVASGPSSWLAGQKNINANDASKSSAESGAIVIPSAGGVSRVGQEPKSSVFAKRSMASDLLLRGMGTAIPGMPAINPAPETELPQPVKKEEKNQEQTSIERAFALEIKKKNEVRRTLAITIGVAVSFIVLAIAIFVFFKFGGPSAMQTSTTAFSQFFNATSFAYKGKGKIDLVLSTATDGIPRTGVAKFTIDYAGSLLNSKEGYGDGQHRTKFSGELSSGDFTWKTDTDIETDIRVIGSSLYFRVLSFPSTGNLDPELFKTYWVKVNLSEIAKELALSGVTLAQEQDGYGSFGGQSLETTFNALMLKNSPFSRITNLPDEQLNGVDVYHVKMQADPEKMLALTSALYRKYAGKEFLLTPDQRIRFMDALAKIEGESWVDKKTGALLQASFAGNFDDDVVDVHIKGPVNLQFTFSNYNKQISSETPTPILTLEELKVRMEDYKKIVDSRKRDQGKVERLNTINNALDTYYTARGRYPILLSELYGAGALASSTVEEVKLKAYSYAAYINDISLTKANRCAAKGKVCTYYHIGVNLEDTENPLLQNDADKISDVRGDDNAGCGGEQDISCYDIVTTVSEESSYPPTTTTR